MVWLILRHRPHHLLTISKRGKKMKQKDVEGNEIEADEDEDILVVKEVVHIEDGKHTGHITNMIREVRADFDYLDIYVQLDDVEGDVSIKTGFPAGISEKSTFGKFLISAGIDHQAGDKVSLKDVKARLIGRTIAFQTYTENDFSNIMNKTIKFED